MADSWIQTTLDKLKTGQRATVLEVRGESSAVHQRLMEMGVFAGAAVQVIRFAPLGDPMEVRVQGYSLSVRKAEAAYVDVRLETDPETRNQKLETRN